MQHTSELKRFTFPALLLCGLLSIAPKADAALISIDLFAAGDGLVTRDTATNLEWLDLTATDGESFNDVLAGLGGYTTMFGFAFATPPQVLDLLNNSTADLLTFLGCTFNCGGANPGAFGMIDQSGNIIEYSWFLDGSTGSDPFVPGADTGLAGTGSLLVRTAVPVPATLMLLLTAMLGFGFARARRTA